MIPGYRALTVNGQFFSDAGGTIVDELAFSLASGNEYLASLVSRGLKVDDVAPLIQFSFGTGSNYFLEIAKLRAARLLWSKIVDQYKPGKEDSKRMFIHSTTAKWNKTYYDLYVNMLRTTMEGMAAAIGNSDSISIQPFDLPVRAPGDFSQRIARNQQLILKEEAYLDKVVDPSAGSYFIENLTDSIATHAWNLFLEIEEKGGFLQCIKSGFVQDRVENSARKKDLDIAQRKTVVIGTNQYPNLTEAVTEGPEIMENREDDLHSMYKKLLIHRGSEGFEQVRMQTENWVKNGNKRPGVFLLQTGNLAMRKARATFSTNFFGCAGFEIIDKHGCKTPEDGIKYSLESGAEIVVICSSDEEYAAIVPVIIDGIRKVKPGVHVIVAGYPKDILDSLKSAGVDDFIHVRCNALETLKKFQKELGLAK